MSLKTEITADLATIESDLGNPIFTWSGSNYPFTPSVTDFQRELDTGGYEVVKRLTATIQKFDTSNNAIFTSFPQAQDIISYSDGNTFTKYRIAVTQHDPTGAYMRITAYSISKGL